MRRFWSNKWVSLTANAASAAETFETTVGELAWASALPTYQYDSSNKISAINGSALANYELPTSVSAATDCVTANSANWDSVTGKLETTAFSNVSGTFLTSLPQDLVYTADIQDMATTGQVAEKLDVTAFSDVSGNFLTGVDLTPYQLTADMTAYMTTADSANFYTTANESGYISEVPAGTMNESAFGYDANDKISGYNGSAFAGGSEVPEGVMVESGLEYNAVNEISGYNGSAIAQYGAEKQWLVHDDTIVHISNSAQYALGVNLSAVARLLGVDETVLQDNIATSATKFTLSEPAGNFDRLRLYDSYGTIAEVSGNNNRISWTFDRTNSNGTRMNRCYTITSNNGIDWDEVNVYGWNQTAYTGALVLNGGTNWYLETTKIVGIGRRSNT